MDNAGNWAPESSPVKVTVTTLEPTVVPFGQYHAEYYNNLSLSGIPIFTRNEGSINYDWGGDGPGNGVGNDNFSVRWTGRFNFSAGSYTFTARADDGIRVWVDGNSIIDAWRDQSATGYQANYTMSEGEHEVKVEYYERSGQAVAQVRWESKVTSGNPSYEQISIMLTQEAKKYNIPSVILKAMAWQESQWRQFDQYGRPLLGKDGDVGIMQITPVTVDDFNSRYQLGIDKVQLAYNVEYNADIGANLLSLMFQELPKIGDGDRNVLENWYFAIWRFNGVTSSPSHPDSILSLIANPPVPYWQGVQVSRPKDSDYTSAKIYCYTITDALW